MPNHMNPTRAFQPDYASAPGATVADMLDQVGMTQMELAQRLGVSPKHINQVVKGVASISAELALGLEKVFGVSTAFWLNRQSLYRADIARQKESRELASALDWAKSFPVAELRKRRLISSSTGPDLVNELLHFFAIASPKLWSDPVAAYRKSQRFESDEKALATWLRLGEIEAAAIECAPFDNERFHEAVREARGLTRLNPAEWEPALIRICAHAGVAVVIVDTFRGARANGATRWLSPTKALIQMSLRHRWEDIFWFSFFHEAAHVLLHGKKRIFIEGTGLPRDHSLQQWEEEADRFASRTLVPPEHDHELRRLTLTDIPTFAEQIGVDPGIVVGRLQHERLIPNQRGNELRHRLAFAEQEPQ
ncbi:plasmid maintenance system antidote protein [Mycobacterium marinum M]|uniref:Plasmid maintenance system antidote protein n=2 Tax=Mycobacterium marinum TaxID=1781 RepID=B2HL42_MYCMM|nr:HigA family addiction module antitoxin [Mycobacterium marinum]ACC42018.1 plasmid maintenance system antidote protein [Mycobacterium marinum M]